MSTLAVKGGIGDFLQYLPFMLENPENIYLVASHYDRVMEFFDSVGLTVQEVSLGRLTKTKNCPRTVFLDHNPFNKQKHIFQNGPVLGIHLGGSNYSISVEKRFGFPSKALPRAVFDALIRAFEIHDILVFGTQSEFDVLIPEWRELENERLKFVIDDDVTKSLSRVTECSLFIGSDSAFKTMSAMMHIRTIVWLGDYKDDFRDSNFIEPYVKAGIMSVFRYRDLSLEQEIKEGIRFCQN